MIELIRGVSQIAHWLERNRIGAERVTLKLEFASQRDEHEARCAIKASEEALTLMDYGRRSHWPPKITIMGLELVLGDQPAVNRALLEEIRREADRLDRVIDTAKRVAELLKA